MEFQKNQPTVPRPYPVPPFERHAFDQVLRTRGAENGKLLKPLHEAGQITTAFYDDARMGCSCGPFGVPRKEAALRLITVPAPACSRSQPPPPTRGPRPPPFSLYVGCPGAAPCSISCDVECCLDFCAPPEGASSGLRRRCSLCPGASCSFKLAVVPGKWSWFVFFIQRIQTSLPSPMSPSPWALCYLSCPPLRPGLPLYDAPP